MPRTPLKGSDPFNFFPSAWDGQLSVDPSFMDSITNVADRLVKSIKCYDEGHPGTEMQTYAELGEQLREWEKLFDTQIGIPPPVKALSNGVNLDVPGKDLRTTFNCISAASISFKTVIEFDQSATVPSSIEFLCRMNLGKVPNAELQPDSTWKNLTSAFNPFPPNTDQLS